MIKNIITLVLMALFTTTSMPSKAQELTGCAADTYNAMKNMAILESQRENLFNQTYIAKPDSIFQYTCFNEETASLAANAKAIFSETDAWHNRTVDISGTTVPYQIQMDVYMPGSLSSALQNVVTTTLIAYLNKNFNHTPLGGTPERTY